MKVTKGSLLVLIGLIVGCGAGAVAGPRLYPAANANPHGGWMCGVVDRFPDVNAARNWTPALNIEQGLNTMALHTPAGQTLSVRPRRGNDVDVLCVKY